MSALNATYPSSNTTVSTGGVVALYHRCGGINWTGPTECEAGSYCKEQNPYYYQCVAVESAYTHATSTGSNADYINTLLASGPSSARPTTLVTITASSAAAVTPTSAAEDEDDYCNDEETGTVAVSPTAAATPSAAAATEEKNDYCEDEETVTVSVTPRPTASAAAAAEDDDDYCEDEQ